MRYITVLGSTGSIGTQTLDVVRRSSNLKVLGLTGNKNIDLLEKQIREFKPVVAAVGDENSYRELKQRVKDTNTTVLC